jgi:glycosyltransferase involved in cell wall biosynthesis
LYQQPQASLKPELGLEGKFVVGHFSRLSPWKGQHILLEALQHCPENVVAILVGDALFGEQDYVQRLHTQVTELGLENRVKFLGFRSDIIPLMSACDLVTHTSTVAEPFGRVIVEAMLCGTPVVATEAGGAIELVEDGKTGWLVEPGNVDELAATINTCLEQPQLSATIAQQAKLQASQRFDVATINQQIEKLLSNVAM